MTTQPGSCRDISVSILGDGTQQPQIIAGDKLLNYDALFQVKQLFCHHLTTQAGSNFQITKSIKEAKEDLERQLFSLEESGGTALGPAIVVALGMAASKSGSKVVLCTDGLSNIGLGSLDELYTDQQKEEVAKFYEQVGLFAQSKGISISVIR